ncbi:MAG: hypothetical protein WA463_00750 [Terriglobales bacterium]
MNMKFHAGAKAVGLAMFLLAGLWGQSLLAANVQVGNCQSKTGVATITLAVAAVSPGGTIKVCPGTYPEQVVISKPLTIQGIQDGNSDAAVIIPPSGGLTANTTRLSPFLVTGRPVAAQILVNATTGPVNISNLTVDGSGNGITYPCGSEIILAGIYYRAAKGTVQYVATRNQIIAPTGCDDRAFGIMAESGGTLASPVPLAVTIQYNSLRSFGTVGIAADDFGLKATITWNTLSSAALGVNAGIQIVAATGSATGNSISLGGNDFSTGISADASHAVVISGNTVGHGGTGIAVSSDDIVVNGDADNGKITANNVFDSSGGIDLTDPNPDNRFENAGILVCSNNNLVQGNYINGSTVAAVLIDTCFNNTFGSTGNKINGNEINEACAGVWFRTAGNIVKSNQFTNVANILESGNSCSSPVPLALTLAPASSIQSGLSVNTRRRGPQ